MLPGTRILNPTTWIIIPSRNNLKGCVQKPKNILTKGTIRHRQSISRLQSIQSSSSEEDESSVPIKKSTKPQQQAPEPEHQDSTDPVFYREVDMSDLPSQYAEWKF